MPSPLAPLALITSLATAAPPVAAPDAPDLELTLHDGQKLDLGTEAQKSTVLVYFYPKDDTPGCTVEAKGIRDHYPAFRKAGIRVIGVSLQDASSHKAFISKYELPFALAVDDGSLAKAFGVPVQGEYAARQSFLLRDGKIVRSWRKVDPKTHAQEVLSAAEGLPPSAPHPKVK